LGENKISKVAVMQPYFLPYMGYFQLINYADTFVIYDDVQYTKKGWINRNLIPSKHGVMNFTIPCKASGEKSLIREKEIAPDFNRKKFLNRLMSELQRLSDAPEQANELLAKIVLSEETNLFKYISNSLFHTADFLNITRDKFVVSSSLGDFTHLQSQDKVIGICKALGATQYINPISGNHLYQKNIFQNHGIDLQFFKSDVSNFGVAKYDGPFSVIHTIFTLTLREAKELLNKGGITNVSQE